MGIKINFTETEEAVNFLFPEELKDFYRRKPEGEPVMLNCKHLINDWKYDYDFELLQDEKLILRYSLHLTDSLKQKALCFAWSYQSVEKDTGLFYLADGYIYGYSGNHSKQGEPDFIAHNLQAILNPGLADKFLTIEDILKSENWYYGDQECVDRVGHYEKVIENYFINISDKQLKLQEFQGEELDSERRLLKLRINDFPFEFKLKTYRGWIDPEVIKLMNTVLTKIGFFDKKFVEIHDRKWGQEIGVAFVNKDESAALKKGKYLKE